MQMQNARLAPLINKAANQDLQRLKTLADAMGRAKDVDYFERNLADMEKGGRVIFILTAAGQDAGYVILNWRPRYGYFRAHDMPEIQDLNVLPSFRRQGLASLLIRHCEGLAAARGCARIGISFGLHPGFGAAQKLYVKLGYRPDGNGVTYDRTIVQAGEFRPVDDNLCLMMEKDL